MDPKILGTQGRTIRITGKSLTAKRKNKVGVAQKKSSPFQGGKVTAILPQEQPTGTGKKIEEPGKSQREGMRDNSSFLRGRESG